MVERFQLAGILHKTCFFCYTVGTPQSRQSRDSSPFRGERVPVGRWCEPTEPIGEKGKKFLVLCPFIQALRTRFFVRKVRSTFCLVMTEEGTCLPFTAHCKLLIAHYLCEIQYPASKKGSAAKESLLRRFLLQLTPQFQQVGKNRLISNSFPDILKL